jgi:hypothetical protein
MSKRVSGKPGTKDAQSKQNASNKQSSQNSQAKSNAESKQNSQTVSKQSSQGANQQPGVKDDQGKLKATNRQAARRAAMQAAKHQQRLEEQKIEKRTRMIIIFSVLAAVVVFGAAIAGITYYNSVATNSTSEAIANPAYPPVDGIYCDTLEQTVYHIHAHVSIYINGKLSSVPQYVGIASDGSCYYWLHTHDTSGVIHIESPDQHTYTFGNFLDEWSAHFSSLGYPAELDFTTGWKIWVNGQPYTGSFRNIPLTAHALITMAYDSPGVKPDTTYAWNGL